MAARTARTGSITEADQGFIETWENIAKHGNGIVRLDRRGDEGMEVVVGRRRFMISTEERLITEDRILDAKNDPFKNGDFRPIVVPDSVSVETNPNALSDDEIRSIFASSELAWTEWLAALDSPQTLRRMIDLASEEETDISLKRYKTLQRRLDDVQPRQRVVSESYEKGQRIAAGGTGRQSAETVPAASRGRRGGQSADYR